MLKASATHLATRLTTSTTVANDDGEFRGRLARLAASDENVVCYLHAGAIS